LNVGGGFSTRRSRDAAGRSPNQSPTWIVLPSVGKFLLWCILLVLCWPLALLAILVYPIVWILLLPFRIVGIAVDGLLGVLRGIVLFPTRLLNGPRV
jgi:hypothetical protein